MNNENATELFYIAMTTIVFLMGIMFMIHQKDSLYEMQSNTNVEIIQKQEIQEKYDESINIDAPAPIVISGATVLQEILDNHEIYSFLVDGTQLSRQQIAKRGAPYVRIYVNTGKQYQKTYIVSDVTNIDDKTEGLIRAVKYTSL